MKSMQIAKLRHRIVLQEHISSRDSFGAELKTWSDKSKVWASIEPLSGKEYFAVQQVNAEVNTKITIRYRTGIKPTMRVLFEGRVFEILSILNTEEKNIQLVLMCKEVLDSGQV